MKTHDMPRKIVVRVDRHFRFFGKVVAVVSLDPLISLGLSRGYLTWDYVIRPSPGTTGESSTVTKKKYLLIGRSSVGK
jgi:hypothetical protein